MLTLKKIELNSRLSEETLCFSAEVFWLGRYIGIAENRGNGSETWVRNYGEQNNATAQADQVAAEEWAKTQPFLDEYGDQLSLSGTPDFHDLPSYVDFLVAEWDIQRTYKRTLTRKFKTETWFETTEGNVMVIKSAFTDALAAHVASKYAGAVILNSLPIEEAVAKVIKADVAQMKIERDKKGSN